MPLLEGRHDGRKILAEVVILGSVNPMDMTHARAVALLDTGATRSAISPEIVSHLSLRPSGNRPLVVATEQRIVTFYPFRVGIVPAVPQDAPAFPYIVAETEGFEMRSKGDFGVILGMDVISLGDFTIRRYGHWQLRF